MLQKGASCLHFLEHTSTWSPAEVKGDTFSVSSLCDAGDAETPKLGPAHSCYALQAPPQPCTDPPASWPHWSGVPQAVSLLLLLLPSMSPPFPHLHRWGDRWDRAVTGTPSPALVPGLEQTWGPGQGGAPGTLPRAAGAGEPLAP